MGRIAPFKSVILGHSRWSCTPQYSEATYDSRQRMSRSKTTPPREPKGECRPSVQRQRVQHRYSQQSHRIIQIHPPLTLSSPQSTLSPPLHVKDLRVSVHTRHETQSDGSSYCLGHLPLVDGTKTSVPVVLDPAHLTHIFRHHGKVLRESESAIQNPQGSRG